MSRRLVAIMAAAFLPFATVHGAAEAKGKPDSSVVLKSTDTGALIAPSFPMRQANAPWDHEIRVALPRGYDDSSKVYPVLWVLDGSWNFEGAVGVASGSGKALPEMIVVSVGVPVESRAQTGMRRTFDFTATSAGACDYAGVGEPLMRRECEALYGAALPSVKTGGAPAFLAFLVGDIRDRIARDYRVSGEHIMFGFSAGGNFCTYALLSDPASFSGYICGSPSLTKDKGALFEMEEAYAASHKDMKARVFFSAGEAEITEGWLVSAAGVVSSTARMAEILSLRKYPSLELSMRILPGHVHNGPGWQASLYQGLRTLFPTQAEK